MTEQARIIEMVVASLSEADVGDLVLRFSPEANRYEDGKYVGRGVWDTMAIVAANRQSLSLDREMRQKFDRNTGVERAVKVGYPELIAGRKEFEAWRWDRHRYMLRDELERRRDVETLKAVAAVLGFELPPPVLGNGR